MYVALDFVDELSSSLGKKIFLVTVEGPLTIRELFILAGKQSDKPGLSKELEGFMITVDGVLMDHVEAMDQEVCPGQVIGLLPLMEGG
ncbi:MAG TPA: hypothetical protein PLK59_06275 [Synergistales bacterium]|nr:hypothetical protein [Synergistales bacterium]